MIASPRIGQSAIWRRTMKPEGAHRCTVRRIGRKITVEIELRHGGTRLAAVTRERLYPIGLFSPLKSET